MHVVVLACPHKSFRKAQKMAFSVCKNHSLEVPKTFSALRTKRFLREELNFCCFFRVRFFAFSKYVVSQQSVLIGCKKNICRMPTKTAKMFLCVTQKIIALFSNKKLMILRKNTFWKRKFFLLAETKFNYCEQQNGFCAQPTFFFFAWARISCCELQIWNWVFSMKLSVREMLLQATFPVAYLVKSLKVKVQ